MPACARSIEELLDGATRREPMKHADSKSGATFEQVVIGGESFVVKHFTEPDWLADASGDDSVRAVGLYEAGIYERVEGIVDAAVVGAARLSPTGEGWPAALLMRDVSGSFIPLDAAVDLDVHAAFIEAMARLHARFWDGVPAGAYMDFASGYDMLSPRRAVLERDEFGDRSDVLRAVLGGWASYAEMCPREWDRFAGLLDHPAPLVGALRTTPATLLQGDWKIGNLGVHEDGTVLLVDWDRTCEGPATYELAWYLAVNCDRLPESKEASIERYRACLETQGVETTGWWERQLDMALLGGLLQFGWSKTGQPEELRWWNERAEQALRAL